MTQPGIEPRSPGPLANTLTARPMSSTKSLLLLLSSNNKICYVSSKNKVHLLQLPFSVSLSHTLFLSLSLSLSLSLYIYIFTQRFIFKFFILEQSLWSEAQLLYYIYMYIYIWFHTFLQCTGMDRHWCFSWVPGKFRGLAPSDRVT